MINSRGGERLTRAAIEDVPGVHKPGAWKGKLVVGPEFFEPLPEEELRAWGRVDERAKDLSGE
jgi:hypothetical protein